MKKSAICLAACLLATTSVHAAVTERGGIKLRTLRAAVAECSVLTERSSELNQNLIDQAASDALLHTQDGTLRSQDVRNANSIPEVAAILKEGGLTESADAILNEYNYMAAKYAAICTASY